MSEASALPKSYDPLRVEAEISQLWLASGASAADPDDRPPDRRYVVMMPLPNVTGALHMGHAMDNVLQDLLIRWHRMCGDNALWMPGTDHAGIATQAVIEKRLLELEGKTRHDLGREQLVDRIWEWKGRYEARIIEQQQRMGCSCDWRRHRFTMDPVCTRAVRHAFFRMFSDGLIFRGKRLVNWDVHLQTSVSDDEVYHETVDGFFWHLRYPVIDPGPGEPDSVVVATTRPETMLGDTAVAVHPDPEGALTLRRQKLEEAVARTRERDRAQLEAERDEVCRRQRELLPRLLLLRDMARDGRHVRLPLLERPIPLICDEWAKPELGSGCVKVTPAHDPNDYEVWRRHADDIAIISILHGDGTLNAEAGPYEGMRCAAARERVVADLEALGLLADVERRQIEVGHSDRSKTPIEPLLSDQWYVRMGDVEGGLVLGRGTGKEHASPGLVQAAMDAVKDGRVRIHPERYARTYLDWLSEKRDWPISRQLWWGHRIPVWARRGRGARLPLDEIEGLISGPGSVARLHLPEREQSVTLGPDGGPAGAAAPALDESWIIDVCLLQDDDAQVEILHAAGFEQDPDVLDTWFSSALWPFSTLGWPDPETAVLSDGQAALASPDGGASALDYYYPGSCLVTGRDIITLWVARMVLAGLYVMGDVPFTDVFIHANIQDGKGERMSKSKGNGIDPVDIIQEYGADAMRYVLCEMQTGSQDIRLPVLAVCPECGHPNDLSETEHGDGGKRIFTYVCGQVPGRVKRRSGSCGIEFDVLGTMPDIPVARPVSDRFEIGRSVCTKLWNSARFAFMHLHDVPTTERRLEDLEIEDRWILDRLSQAVRAVHQGLLDYNPSAAIAALREFFWSELCDWYLELIKHRLQGDDGTGPQARQVLALCLDQVLRLFHPFIPFITESLWQRLGEQVPLRGLGPLFPAHPARYLVQAAWPEPLPEVEDVELRTVFADLQAVTRGIREVRAATSTPPGRMLEVTIKPPPARARAIESQAHVVSRLARLGTIVVDPEARRGPGSAAKHVGGLEVFVHDVIDDDEERARLERELLKIDAEIETCTRKLANSRFVERAPAAVVDEERQRLEDHRARREALARGVADLG